MGGWLDGWNNTWFSQIFPLLRMWNEDKIMHQQQDQTAASPALTSVAEVKFHHIFITSCCCSEPWRSLWLYLSLFSCVFLSTVRVCGRSLKEVERALPLFATQLSAGTVDESAQVMRAGCLQTSPVSEGCLRGCFSCISDQPHWLYVFFFSSTIFNSLFLQLVPHNQSTLPPLWGRRLPLNYSVPPLLDLLMRALSSLLLPERIHTHVFCIIYLCVVMCVEIHRVEHCVYLCVLSHVSATMMLCVCVCVCMCVCDTTFSPTLVFELCPEAHPRGRRVWSNGCILGTKWSVPNPHHWYPRKHTRTHTHTHTLTYTLVWAHVFPQGGVMWKQPGGWCYSRFYAALLFKMSSWMWCVWMLMPRSEAAVGPEALSQH